MKNKIITIVVVLVLGVIIFFIGRSYYYNSIYNYNVIIDNSLEKFYVTSSTSDLDPTASVLDIYKDNEVKLRDIQLKIYDHLKGWIDFLNSKYICDSGNVNSCRLFFSELTNMKANIRKVYVYRDKMLSQDKFASLNQDLELKIEEVKEIIDDPSSVRSRNYEELRLDKCSKVTDCSECRTALCDCTYVNTEGKKEIVKCKVTPKETN